MYRFSEIALTAPDYKFDNGDRAGEIAANLVLDSYNAQGDYKKVNEWARRFYANDKLATGKFKEELSKVIEQSSFKLVNALEEKHEYAAAAQAYLDFVKDFPRTQIADKALYNASTDFYKAHMLEKALATRELLFRNYPKSTLVPLCQWANAEGYEAIGDFEHAAEAYELYVSGYEKQLGPAEKTSKKTAKKKSKKGKSAPASEEPKKEGPVWEEAKAQIALFNAGVYREGLGQLKQALRNRERYLELWPNAKDSETVALSIADLHERTGNYSKSVAFLEERAREQERDPNKFLATQARILVIQDQKLKNPKAVARTEKTVLDYYDKLYRRQKDALDPPAKEAVARASYSKNEEQFQFYARQKLHWGKGRDPVKEFRESIKQKGKSLDEINRLYTNTVALGAAEPAICSLRKIGLAYENMADSVANAPMLRSLPPEAQEELKNQLDQQAQPIREKAADHFAAAVTKSRELGVRSECATKSLQALRGPTGRPSTRRCSRNWPRLASPAACSLLRPAAAGAGAAGGRRGGAQGDLRRPRPHPVRWPPARDCHLEPGGARQDDTSDLRPGQRPTDARAPVVVPAKTHPRHGKSSTPSRRTSPSEDRPTPPLARARVRPASAAMPRLASALLALGLAVLVGCATSAPAAKAPSPRWPPQSPSDPAGPNSRALLLFEDANKAAEAQAKSGNRDDATLERRYQAVRDADPSFAEADYNLGVLAERQGKREQAFAAYKSALQKKPSLKPAAEGLARLTQTSGDVPAAIAQWTDIARAFPDDASSRAQLAELYRITADHDRAQEFARQALIRDPRNLSAYKTMLRSNLDRKQYAMAELVGVRALKISTTDPELFLALGDVQMAKGSPDKAIAQYQKALEVKAGLRPRAARPGAAGAEGRGLRCRREAPHPAVADGGGTAEVHLNLGVAYRGLGQVDKALAEYDAAEKLDPKLARGLPQPGHHPAAVQGRSRPVAGTLQAVRSALGWGVGTAPGCSGAGAAARGGAARGRQVAGQDCRAADPHAPGRTEAPAAAAARRRGACPEGCPREDSPREGGGQAVGGCGPGESAPRRSAFPDRQSFDVD